jgi:cytochrome c biogenesis protein CcmG, thiol:disulfide interchange protein DsbE
LTNSRKIRRTSVSGRFLTLSVFLLITMWCGHAAGQTTLRTGDAFPEISLAQLDGNKVVLPAAAAGRVVIIHFWAGWCPYCMKEMCDIESILTDFKDKGVVAYSINAGQSAEAAREYMAKTTAAYPILLDPTQEATKKCGVNSIPTTFICDRNGIIRFRILGEVNKRGLEKLLSTIL